MPLRTTLISLIAAVWTTGLLYAQAPDADVQKILDKYRLFRHPRPPPRGESAPLKPSSQTPHTRRGRGPESDARKKNRSPSS
jgi:hypothetical protein